jgi:hypothetical protein
VRWLVCLLACGAIGWYGVTLVWSLARGRPARSQVALLATPRAWLAAYESAAVLNPDRVCQALFSPQLSRMYGRYVHSTCERYFANVTSDSQKLLGILRDGATAILNLRQTSNHQLWAIVLDHSPAGWQAVDLTDSFLR